MARHEAKVIHRILLSALVAMSCTVTAVLDGDTLVARCPSAAALHVRLAEVDAPEKRQAYGGRSKAHLRRLCLGQPAIVTPTVRDKYGRTVARVSCAGQDASEAQARAGYAWAYTKYLTDPGIADLAQHARAERMGLWRSNRPIEPQAWRRGVR